MLSLATIGTSAITKEFIEAAVLSGAYQVTACYSRQKEKAQAFIKDLNLMDCQAINDWQELLTSSSQVLYIASPNSLHYAQAKDALLSGKHVIVEKPAVTKPEDWQELLKLAEEQGLYIFEAARHIHEEAWLVIEDFLKDKTILGASLSYAKYSSKMKDLLASKTPNVFSPEFAGGALMDLGIYPLYAAHLLWGPPKEASYKARQLDNTIDLAGHALLDYGDFQVSLKTGKDYNSLQLDEIYTDQGTLILSSCQQILEAVFCDLEGDRKELELPFLTRRMLPEARAFASIIENQDQETFQNLGQIALDTHTTLYQLRHDAGIIFQGE